MNKSFKLGFAKNERKDKSPDLKIAMHSEGRKAYAQCIFVQCGKIELNEEPTELVIPAIDSINLNRAYSFIMNMPEDGPDADSIYNVAFVKNKNKVSAYIYGSVYVTHPSWTLIMRVDISDDTLAFNDPFRTVGKKFPEHAYISRENLAKRVIKTVLTFNQYGYVLTDDLTKNLSLRSISYSDRPTYNNYILDKSAPETQVLINTIEYNYEGSDINLEQSMLEELPFHKFYLKVSFIKETLQPIWVLFDHGKLHALMGVSERSSKVSIGYVDLNEAKYGSPINVNVNKVKDFLSKDGYDIQDVAHMLNVCCRAFLEFMYKFNRLMPYSENVSNSFTEHVAHVVNNTSVHKIVILNPESKKRSTQGHKGGKHASPREHVRIGHKRVYKSGIEIWVNEITVNEGNLGKITKTYRFADKE